MKMGLFLIRVLLLFGFNDVTESKADDTTDKWGAKVRNNRKPVNVSPVNC